MKPAIWMALACASVTALAALGGAFAQNPPTGKDGAAEVNVVLRVTRKIVSDITTKTVDRTTPIQLCVLNTPLTGVARTTGTATLLFDDRPESGEFDVLLRGASVSRSVVDNPPVQVFGSGRLDFALRKRVTFDGIKFSSQPATIDARFCSTIDGLATPPGLFGLLVEWIAMPKIRRQEPIYAQAAFDDGKAQLVKAFDEEVEKSLKDLNEVSPLEKTVNTLFPETKDWIFYPLTTSTHLLIGLGPRDRKLPVLPITDKTDAPIELWIRNKPETKAMILVMQLWKDANKQLKEMLPADIGKSLPLGEGFKTLTVKDWFVIQLGQGLKDSPKEKDSQDAVVAARARGAGGRVYFAQDRLAAALEEPAAFAWRSMGPATAAALAAMPRPIADSNSVTIVWRPVVTRRASEDKPEPRPDLKPKK
jgi:hypothetical protein